MGFTYFQALDFKARSLALSSLFKDIAMRDLERYFPIVFGYEAHGKEDSVDSKVKYRVAGEPSRYATMKIVNIIQTQKRFPRHKRVASSE